MTHEPKDPPAVERVFDSARGSLTWSDRIPPLPCAITLPAALYELVREAGIDLGPTPSDVVH